MSGRAFVVRSAVADDAPTLARHRVGMLVHIGSLTVDDPRAARIEAASRRFIDDAMRRGEWAAWIAEERDAVLGSGSALLRPLPPSPVSLEGGFEAYLLNVFTEPAARRRGVATAVMKAALAWCRAQGFVRTSLRASAAGRPVYEPLGFVAAADYMDWKSGV
jgi:GNAT superfamily N-acetyltransferase